MGGEWKETTLGHEVDFLTGFPFKSEGYTDDESGIKLLRGDNIVQGALRLAGVKRWPASDCDEYSRYQLNVGDVILAMDRPWIDAGLKYAAISQNDLPALLVQRTARLRGGRRLDTRFLRYVIGSASFTQHILAVQTGTAVPHISGPQIKEYRFSLPPLPVQLAIADILGSMDDKIELNRRMNETLEAMARAVFKSWFVDFDPVVAKSKGRQPEGMDAETARLFPSSFQDSEIGRVPKGWKVGAIGDYVTVVGGSTPSTSDPSFWGGTHCFCTPKDLSTLSSPVLLDTERKVTDKGVGEIGSGLLPPGTVLLSSRAPIGYLVVTEVPTAVNQGFIAMVCDKALPNLYVLRWTEANMDVIKGRANGTTFMEVSKTAFRPISVVVPPPETLSAFSQLAASLHVRVVCNLKEDAALATIRDQLLPSLLTGEKRVQS